MKKPISFNIGDTFLSWQVAKLVDPKKYNYLCRCSCGKERVFNKYNLLNGSYSVCKDCAPNLIKNVQVIKRHWNTELNKVVFTKPQDFNLTTSYWFICESGHNFKCSIKDFDLNRCRSCQTKDSEGIYKALLFEYTIKLLQKIYTDTEKLCDDFIIIPSRKIIVHISESDRAKNKNYFSSEKSLIDYLDKINSIKLHYLEQNYTYKELKICNEDLLSNIDKIESLVVECL